MGANAVTMAADVDHYCVVNDAVDDGADHHVVGEDQAASEKPRGLEVSTMGARVGAHRADPS